MATDNLSELLGDETLRVVDIGARGRLAEAFRPLAGRVDVIGFEPDPDECARLNAELSASPWRSARVLPHAVGRPAAARPFYVTAAPELSSLYEPGDVAADRASWQVTRVVAVDTVALDDLAERGELLTPVDFIKVDTQGSELEILQSGEARVLDGVLGVAAEAEFRELYRGQPRLSELELYLRQRGFDLLLVEPRHVRSGWPLARKPTSYCDALFLRGRAWLDGLSEAEQMRALPRLLVLYLLHGLYTEALALAEGRDARLAAAVERAYDAIDHGGWRWRARMLGRALACAVSPTVRNRTRLANLSRAVYGAGGVGWPVEPP